VALTVIDHPLAGTMLTALRDKATPPPLFRLLTKRLALALALEATRSVPLRPVEVRTPLAPARGVTFDAPLVAVPILRAGLGMLEAVTELFPEVAVGYIGLERDHATFQPSAYYSKLPPMRGAYVLVLDPMLATGGSAVATVDILKNWGAQRIKFVGLIAAPEGVQRLSEAHPDVPIHVAVVDDHLNDIGYIVPGLGDAGDRQFGTG
jgi:uracil phosphoribosyltransferase